MSPKGIDEFMKWPFADRLMGTYAIESGDVTAEEFEARWFGQGGGGTRESSRDPRSWLLMGRRRHRGIMKGFGPLGQAPSAGGGVSAGDASTGAVGIGGGGVDVGVGGTGARTGRAPLMGMTPQPGDPEFESMSREGQRLLMEQKREDTRTIIEQGRARQRIHEFDEEAMQLDENNVRRGGKTKQASRVYFMLSDRWNA